MLIREGTRRALRELAKLTGSGLECRSSGGGTESRDGNYRGNNAGHTVQCEGETAENHLFLTRFGGQCCIVGE